MIPNATQGTDRVVKSISVLLGPGAGQAILVAQAGIAYRVTGSQISLDAAGTFAVYHGVAYGATKVIAEGFAAANGGSNPNPGDWALQAGQANEAVSADISGGNARIVLTYIEIQVLG